MSFTFPRSWVANRGGSFAASVTIKQGFDFAAHLTFDSRRHHICRPLGGLPALQESSIPAFGTISQFRKYKSGRARIDLASFLREMYYIVVSEQYVLPYWPQFTRLSFSKRFPNYFDATFRTKLFRRVAQALKFTVTEAFDDLGEQVAFIPPFSRSEAHDRKTSPPVCLRLGTNIANFAKT